MKRMLLSLAHPDDESFAVGGTVFKYAKIGWQVYLLSATTGQAGNSGSTALTGAALGEVRKKELAQAAGILGIGSVKFLDYWDGKLAKILPGELEDKIYQEIERVLPEVVITFEPDGVSNHPDHQKICLSTTVAFQRYAQWLVDLSTKPAIYGKHDENWYKRLEKMVNLKVKPQLYFTCLPASIVQFAQKIGAIPRESFGRPWVGVPDKKVTTVIDIQSQGEKKVQAMNCHLTQITQVERFLTIDDNPLLRQEFYIKRFEGTEEVFMGKNDFVASEL